MGQRHEEVAFSSKEKNRFTDFCIGGGDDEVVLQRLSPVQMTLKKSTSSSWRRRQRDGFPRTTTFFFLVLFSMIFNDECVITCAPIHRDLSASSMQHYLLKFGYLPQSGFEIRDQVTEERMRDAIRELQAFANITVTGEINEETRRLIQRPRCGVPDILSGQFRNRRRRFIIQGQKWPNTSLTWSLKRPSPAHTRRDIIEELTRAFAVWSESTSLRFYQLDDSRADDADIRIIFSKGYHDDGYPFDGKGSILAHAFFPGSGQGGDAHFDDDEVWIVNSGRATQGEGTRLFAVAAHEFGHSLGLSHSDVEGALMYPWYQHFDYGLRLSRDDQLGIQGIYGPFRTWTKNPFPPDGTNRIIPTSPTSKPPVVKPSYPGGGTPNTCDSSYDAISLIRDELFIFKGPYFWRIQTSAQNDNRLLNGYPSLITLMWQQLPANLTHVDAVYEHNSTEIVFFIGQKYWRFEATKLKPGYPKSLTSMGISKDVAKIDGAMTWGHNGKTYIFSGSKYWRLQDKHFRVELDYPRDMYVWKGVPYGIDSVLKWKDEKVYFFKGKVFWRFDDKYMRVESETPSLSAPFWMGCTSPPIAPNPTQDPTTSSSTTELSPVMPTFFSLIRVLLPIFANLLYANAYLHFDQSVSRIPITK